MGRRKTTIPVDGTALRDAVERSPATWSSLAERLGVTRQTVSGWVSKGRIPPRQLADLAKELGLGAGEVRRIMAREEATILFRSNRNVDVSPPDEGEDPRRCPGLFQADVPFRPGGKCERDQA